MEQQISGPTKAPRAVPPVARTHILAGPGTVCSAPPGGGVVTGPGPGRFRTKVIRGTFNKLQL